MAVAFDAKAVTVTAQGAPSSPITNSTLTTTGAASIVFGVFTSVTSASLASPIAMTWNGVAMSLVGSKLASDFLSSIYVYAIVSPATGNQTLSCTFTNGTGSQQVDLDCFSFKGSATASVAAAIPSANVISDASTPAGTVYPASAMTVTTVNGDAAIAVANSVSTVLNGANVGTLINTEHASLVNYVSIYNLAVGSTTQVQFTDSGVNGFPCEALAFDLVQPASTASAGGTATDAGTTFKRTFHYQSIAQPVVFTATPIITGWFNSLSIPIRPRIFLQQEDQQPLGSNSLATDNISWLKPFDVPALRKTFSIPDWWFVAPPAQVWFPYAPWDDFARRKPQPLDTQPLAWPPTPVATPFPAMGWINWPDFAPQPRRAIDTPLSFVSLLPSAAQTFDWPDFIRAAPRPLNYNPLAFVQTIQAAQVWYPSQGWPDFATSKARTTSHEALGFLALPPSAQVIADWPDFVRRKPQPLDTQPLSWAGQPIVTAVPVMPWINWPDFALKKPAPLNFTPQTLTQLAPQVWFPYGPWDDFTRRKPQYPDTQPLAFVPLMPSATPIGDWPDFVRRQPQPLDTQPLSWTGQTIAAQQVWFPYDPWPSLIAKKSAPLNFTPATPFIQTPAQVFFPYGPWDDFVRRARPSTDPQSFAFVFAPQATYAVVVGDWPDFARRKPQPLDTQPLVWNPFTPAPTLFFVPTNWPDFASKARPLVDLRPWSFIQSPAQVFFPYGPWDDFTRRKPSPLIYPPTALVPIHVPSLGYLQWPDFATKKRPPLNYIPLTFVQTIRTPWNELSRWPEMVPIQSKAGLHAALQQFLVRFPGTITQATITGILNAFEVNSDIASITILVRQSGPAVRAAVSIQEIGTI